jgi:Ca2+-binding EF-hand superfamily protein
LKAAFNKFDKDNDKTISVDELKSMFSNNKESTDDLMKAIIAEGDGNNDGMVSFSEFQTMMKSASSSKIKL